MTGQPVDVTGAAEFSYSAVRMILYILLGVFVTGLCIWPVFTNLDSLDWYSVGALAGCAIFSGVLTGLASWRLATSRGSVLSVSPTGVHDRRVTTELVPWDWVNEISEYKMRSHKFINIRLIDGIEGQLALTQAAKLSKKFDRVFGTKGLYIGAQGLNVRHSDLLRIIFAFAGSNSSTAIDADPGEFEIE